MPEECGWRLIESQSSGWQLQPVALMLEDGGFLEIDGCGLLLLENAYE